jgi:hypothetical protein
MKKLKETQLKKQQRREAMKKHQPKLKPLKVDKRNI